MAQKVSVIIPVYNRQNYVQECIESILAQTYDNFEIILIDDGSSDRTVAICREMAEKDARIKVLEQQHRGVSAARNVGIETANGEYLFFIDSDDVIHPQLIETFVSAMAETKAPMGACRTINVTQQYWQAVTHRLQSQTTPAKTIHLQHESAIGILFESNAFLCVMGGVIFRRDLVESIRFRTDLFIGEDYFFIYENLIHATSLLLIDENWYCLRLHKENSSWNYSFHAFYSRFYRRKLVWESELAHGRPQNAVIQKRDAFSSFLLCVSKEKTSAKDRRQMRATMRQHKKELFPALNTPSKVHYILSVYFPIFYPAFLFIKQRIRALKKKLS